MWLGTVGLNGVGYWLLQIKVKEKKNMNDGDDGRQLVSLHIFNHNLPVKYISMPAMHVDVSYSNLKKN